jgi:VanZ family protein
LFKNYLRYRFHQLAYFSKNFSVTSKIFNYLFLPLAWTLAVQILLVIPGKNLPKAPVDLNIDKLIHFILFAGMAWLWCRYLMAKKGVTHLKKKFFYIMLAVLANGIMMEFVQKFIPNRSFDIIDIVADSLGGIFGYWLIIRRAK